MRLTNRVGFALLCPRSVALYKGSQPSFCPRGAAPQIDVTDADSLAEPRGGGQGSLAWESRAGNQVFCSGQPFDAAYQVDVALSSVRRHGRSSQHSFVRRGRRDDHRPVAKSFASLIALSRRRVTMRRRKRWRGAAVPAVSPPVAAVSAASPSVAAVPAVQLTVARPMVPPGVGHRLLHQQEEAKARDEGVSSFGRRHYEVSAVPIVVLALCINFSGANESWI